MCRKSTAFFAALAALFAGILIGITMSPMRNGLRFCNNSFFCNNNKHNEASVGNNAANGRFRPKFALVDNKQNNKKGKKKDKKSESELQKTAEA